MNCAKWVLCLLIVFKLSLCYGDTVESLLTRGSGYLNKGTYELAQKYIEQAITKSDGHKGTELLVKLFMLQGKYEHALSLAQKMIHNDRQKFRGNLLLSDILLAVGRYEQAKEVLLDAYRLQPNSITTQARLGLYYLMRGQKDKYVSYFDRIFEEYDPDRNYAAEELTYIAKACRYYAMKTDYVDRDDTLVTIIQQILPNAITREPYFFPAHQELVELFIDMFNPIEAKSAIEDALQLNPNHPQLLVLQAKNKLQRFIWRPEAMPILERALRINPNLVSALNLKASIYLSDQEYDKAERVLQKAISINPCDLRSRSLMAAFYYMRGRDTAYQKECEKVLAINPNYGELYFTLASMIMHKRQFAEVVEFNRKAIEVDPFLWHAYIELGTGLMRVGKDKEASKYLDKVYEEFNAHKQTRNMRTLLKKYKEFKVYHTPHFKIRLHVSEADILFPLVSELLEEGFRVLCKKYKFTPETPIIFEMFPEHRDFAVRTIGLEGLGATGACFGQVVVADSPKAHKRGAFNWASVVWHEFTHVITLQMTNYQVPRWFTEGLSEFAEKERNPACQRKLDLDLYSVYSSGNMRGIADLNAGFTRPKYPSEIAVCYYQAGLICEFITQKFGFEKILQMLHWYGKDKKDQEVFQIALGMTAVEFDRAFSNWLQKNIFDKMKVFPSIDPRKIEDLKDLLLENPANKEACLKLSLGYLQQHKFTDAEIYANRLLVSAPNNPSTFEIMGYIADRRGNLAQARKLLERAVKLGSENFYTYRTLGMIYWHKYKDATRAIEAFKKAKASYPGYVKAHNPYEMLAKIYFAQNERDKAIRELEAYIERHGNNYQIRMDLAQEYLKSAKYKRAIKVLVEARDIFPLEFNLHNMLAEAYQKTSQFEKSEKAYLIALVLASKKEKYVVYTKLAEVCLQQRKVAKAKLHIEEALRRKADYAVAQQLAQKILDEDIVEQGPGIQVVMSDTQDPCPVGSQTIYVVEVKNNSNRLLTNIKVKVFVPDEMELIIAKGPSSYVLERKTIIFKHVPMLQSQEQLFYKIICQAVEKGTAKKKIAVYCDQVTQPVISQEYTKLFQK